MRQRATFIVKPNTPPTNPEQFVLSPGSNAYSTNNLEVKDLHAAHQEKWTIARPDIPPKVWDVLKSLSELHIRWSTPKTYDTINPFSSRVPAGLHIQAAPLPEENTNELCTLLSSAFSTKPLCKSLNETFIEFPGKRYYLYSNIPEVLGNEPQQLNEFLKKIVCNGNESCVAEIERLAAPDYIDIDYNSRSLGSRALTISAFWHRSPEGGEGQWNHKVQQLADDHRAEVGILDQRPSLTDGRLTFGGVLTVLGEDQQLKPTFFSFPARHQQNSGSYSGSFSDPAGLHPKFLLKIDAAEAPSEDCTLNAYFSIPKDFFIDKYQLADQQLLESLGLKKLKAFRGEADLEAPTWTQSRWGSSALFEVDPKKVDDNGLIDVELPLHMRYQEPGFVSEYTPAKLPWPTVFWACPASAEWQQFVVNPFDRGYLGYDVDFPKETAYHHLSPVNGTTYSTVHVPVLEMKHAPVVKIGTAVVVGVGFLYIVAKILGSVMKKSEPKKKAE